MDEPINYFNIFEKLFTHMVRHYAHMAKCHMGSVLGLQCQWGLKITAKQCTQLAVHRATLLQCNKSKIVETTDLLHEPWLRI